MTPLALELAGAEKTTARRRRGEVQGEGRGDAKWVSS